MTSFSVYFILYMFQEIMRPSKEIINLIFQSLYNSSVSTDIVDILC